MSPAVRTNPAKIRAVLADADRTSGFAAAKKYGLHHSTVRRWRLMRERVGPEWPTVEDVEAWRADHEAHAEERARRAAQQRSYKKRRYLSRGLMHVDPTGTVRRLRALFALGWTAPELADRLGVTGARVGHIASGRWKAVHRDTAASVDRLYRELCMTVPQDPEVLPPRRIRVHERQRKWARRKGYAPPLAWDNIDDPSERPAMGSERRPPGEVDEARVQRVLDGERLATTKAEKEEIMRRWVEGGRSKRELAVRMGWKQGRYGRGLGSLKGPLCKAYCAHETCRTLRRQKAKRREAEALSAA